MRVILMRDVRHTGKRGEVLDVKDGYARNFLIPKGMALEAKPGNLKVFEQQRRKIEQRHERERDGAATVAGELAGVTLEVAKRVGESETLYGSVTASEVAEALETQGFEVDRRRIDLSGGIKTVGDHVVRIELHSEVTAEVTVRVVPEQ